MGFFEETNNEQVDNSLWVESYRPTTLENYVGNEHLKEKVSGYLENGDIPHLLLYGRAGTGKTTLAKLIVKSVDCDYMIINASDENNVETVRNKVKGFASSMGFKKYNIVILDEFDYMSQKEFITNWSSCAFHFNLDPIDYFPGNQCGLVAATGTINVGGVNDYHHILFLSNLSNTFDFL